MSITAEAESADHPAVQGQTATVQGKVVDTDDESLTGIEVTLRAEENGVADVFDTEEYSATTDENGEFSIEGVEPGTYTVHVDQSGYEESEQTINVSADETEEVELRLNPTY